MTIETIIKPDLEHRFFKGNQTKSKCIMYNYCSFGLKVGTLQWYYGTMKDSKNF